MTAEQPTERTADRPYGRPPTALKQLASSLQYRLSRVLRETPDAKDHAVHVKAVWLRDDAYGYGSPDYRFAYVWIAPVVMSFELCEVIERVLIEQHIDGLIRTGRGGDRDDTRKAAALRPFVYAVIDQRHDDAH